MQRSGWNKIKKSGAYSDWRLEEYGLKIMILAKINQGFQLEHIHRLIGDFKELNARSAQRNGEASLFMFYCSIANNQFYDKDEKDEAFQRARAIVSNSGNRGDKGVISSSLLKKDILIYKTLCEKYQAKFDLELSKGTTDLRKTKSAAQLIQLAKTPKDLERIYLDLKDRKYFLGGEEYKETWRLLIDKTYEISGSIQLFTGWLESCYYFNSSWGTNAHIHIGIAYALINANTSQEMLDYVYEKSGSLGFVNMIKVYAFNKDRERCDVLLKRFVKFCEFLIE